MAMKMEARLTVVVAFFTVIGVILGAALDSYLSKDVEFSRQIMQVRMQTYKDYVNAQSQFSNAAKEDQPKFTKLIDQAHKQIGVFGSSEVIQSLAMFQESFGKSQRNTVCNGPKRTFLDSVMDMRQDLGIDQPHNPNERDFFDIFRGMAGKFGVEGAGEPPSWEDLGVLMWGCGKR